MRLPVIQVGQRQEAAWHLVMACLRNLLLPGAALALSGCLARTAVDIVTAPVKVASKAVDMATTSQSEADEKRGRELRKREERYGKLQREVEKDDARCRKGDDKACARRDAGMAEMERLRPLLPAAE